MGILATGRKTVTAVGVPERISDLDLPLAGRVDITALSSNTGVIHVGLRDTSAVTGQENGWRLAALDVATFESQQLYDVWIDATVAGEGIHWGAVE